MNTVVRHIVYPSLKKKIKHSLLRLETFIHNVTIINYDLVQVYQA